MTLSLSFKLFFLVGWIFWYFFNFFWGVGGTGNFDRRVAGLVYFLFERVLRCEVVKDTIGQVFWQVGDDPGEVTQILP